MSTLLDILRRAVACLEHFEELQRREKQPIRIWPFEDAPRQLRELSTNGGDEDWIALVPDWIWEKERGEIGFLRTGTEFGVFDVEEHVIPGYVVLIGCHS